MEGLHSAEQHANFSFPKEKTAPGIRPERHSPAEMEALSAEIRYHLEDAQALTESLAINPEQPTVRLQLDRTLKNLDSLRTSLNSMKQADSAAEEELTAAIDRAVAQAKKRMAEANEPFAPEDPLLNIKTDKKQDRRAA